MLQGEQIQLPRLARDGATRVDPHFLHLPLSIEDSFFFRLYAPPPPCFYVMALLILKMRRSLTCDFFSVLSFGKNFLGMSEGVFMTLLDAFLKLLFFWYFVLKFDSHFWRDQKT